MSGIMERCALLILTLHIVFAEQSMAMSDEKRLIKYLLDNYERVGIVGRPVYNTSETVNINYGLALIQIMEFDETSQVLVTNVWQRYSWKDLLLRWNPDDFGGVNHVRVPSDRIWTPDVVLYNYADTRLEEDREALAVISFDGNVLWIPRAILKSSCSVDMTYFPFDEQVCSLKFGSWTYDGFKLDLNFYDSLEEMDMSDYIASNEWRVMDHPAKKNVVYYPCCEEPYPSLLFTLHLKRISAFHNYFLLLPCVLLSVMTLIIFWLPPESSEKITLGMLIFLAFFILLLILAALSPPAASSIPLIGAYFSLNMILITMSNILSTIVKNVSLKGSQGARVPKWLKKLTVDGLAKIMCISNNVTSGDEERPSEKGALVSEDEVKANSESGIAPRGDDIREIKDILKSSLKRIDGKQAHDRNAQEWRIVAEVLDRIFFLIYLVIFIIFLIVIFPKA